MLRPGDWSSPRSACKLALRELSIEVSWGWNGDTWESVPVLWKPKWKTRGAFAGVVLANVAHSDTVHVIFGQGLGGSTICQWEWSQRQHLAQLMMDESYGRINSVRFLCVSTEDLLRTVGLPPVF